jgi:hypothetical protein
MVVHAEEGYECPSGEFLVDDLVVEIVGDNFTLARNEDMTKSLRLPRTLSRCGSV